MPFNLSLLKVCVRKNKYKLTKLQNKSQQNIIIISIPYKFIVGPYVSQSQEFCFWYSKSDLKR
jgi:hypothetical protein